MTRFVSGERVVGKKTESLKPDHEEFSMLC